MCKSFSQLFAAAILLPLLTGCTHSERISPELSLIPGAVNGVVVHKAGKRLVIYGDPSGTVKSADVVLFTHFRRDVTWAGNTLVKKGCFTAAPAGEKEYFAAGDSMWRAFDKARFHDYYCQTTKFGFYPLRIDRYVSTGDTLKWKGIDFRVLETPGYTRGAVSYIARIDGKKFAFTGDLIYGDGKILDLYSLQDSWHDIRGYHGYAARAGKLISSLKLIAAEKPDIIIPSRGPVIKDPEAAIQKLTSSLVRLYRNYLSTTAYRWYYPDQVKEIADSITGSASSVGWMPYSCTIVKNPPSWYRHISNSNLVMADDSTAFLIDCGSEDALDEILKMKHSGSLKKLDGIFITHYHDDHTDLVNDVVREFGCPVYATKELKDILENPSAYHLPCLTERPIPDLTIVENGSTMKWKDFTLTFNFFPGQTIYHDAVLFEKAGGESVFFSGDSFTPSGIDDYCLLNRNLLHKGTGYFYCIDMLKRLPANVLISNQHVEPLFAFSGEQLDHIKDVLQERTLILKEMLPFDDINYGIDEQWAAVYPYSQQASPGGSVNISVRIYNHSGKVRTFILEPDRACGLTTEPARASVIIPPVSEGSADFRVKIPGEASSGLTPVFVSLKSDGLDLHDWCEGMIRISK